MLYVPNEYSLRLPWVLPLFAKRKSELLEVGELDITLGLAYWDDGEGPGYGWEVQHVCLDGPTPKYITPEDDEAFWTLITRAVKADFQRIDAEVQERAADDVAQALYDAPDLDVDMGR